ncbi:hypothetical protein [Paracidovorax valerianellae]|uniref:Uncharacterized protein n=1 Tax=Paracidovorax valerianellae TaxID=187868 RepID=A0A1G6SAV8_9BURK|nr:hypothetical protein [Paracidovorax valerianellae]MDA8444239.1 hypothetical protein [Paracidovorax valerianellae]SDD14028.1 hypothetical protein SAMN05192589_104392 [Paracidovorax valerianellae]
MSAVLTPCPPATAPAQELEASSRVLALIRETAVFLGASQEQAREASRTGTFALESRPIALVPDVDEEALIMSAPLPATCLDDPARRVAALQASTVLVLCLGAVFARGLAGPQLLCRCPLDDASAEIVGRHVLQLAALANAVQVGAPGTPSEAVAGGKERSHVQ